jgi:ribosomal protein S15P/S13E
MRREREVGSDAVRDDSAMPAPALSAARSMVEQCAAPPLGVVRQFANLMNEQQEIEQHHQRQPNDAASRRRRVVQLADPRDDLQDEADAERHMIGPPQSLSQPVIEAMYDAEYFANHLSLSIATGYLDVAGHGVDIEGPLFRPLEHNGKRQDECRRILHLNKLPPSSAIYC